MLTLNDVKLIAETMAGCPGSRMVIHSEDEVRVVGPEEVNLAVIMSDGKPMRSRRILLRVQTTGW